jgi:hypothetical protein
MEKSLGRKANSALLGDIGKGAEHIPAVHASWVGANADLPDDRANEIIRELTSPRAALTIIVSRIVDDHILPRSRKDRNKRINGALNALLGGPPKSAKNAGRPIQRSDEEILAEIANEERLDRFGYPAKTRPFTEKYHAAASRVASEKKYGQREDRTNHRIRVLQRKFKSDIDRIMLSAETPDEKHKFDLELAATIGSLRALGILK